jgi:hypothetical protein
MWHICFWCILILVENLNIIYKNIQTLIYASEKVDLEENAQETEHMLSSRYQNTKRNHNMQIVNNICAKLINQNWSHEEMKDIKKSGNACWRSSQNSLPSRVLFWNVKIILYKTTLFIFICRCVNWSFSLREEQVVCKQSASENLWM